MSPFGAAAQRQRTMERHLIMSQKERTRLGMMQQVKAEKITLVAASKALRLGYRQIKRLSRRDQDDGDGGLVHRGRGRPGNRARAGASRERAWGRYEVG